MMRVVFVRCALFALASLSLLSSRAQPPAGLDLVEISPHQPTTDPSRIVVTEFFSYQCPHCYSFEPVLRHWVDGLPDDVVFERVPISIGRPQWVAAAQAFYALQAMGKLDAVDSAIFRAIHIDGERLFDQESVVSWVDRRGVDAVEFRDAYDSFGIASFVRRAEQIANAHRVFSIPALAIDGRYLVLIVDNGTFERQLAGVDELIEDVRAEKRAP